LPLDALDLLTNMDHLAVDVNVGPAQAQDFTPAHPYRSKSTNAGTADRR
jgi:hypothetical protein